MSVSLYVIVGSIGVLLAMFCILIAIPCILHKIKMNDTYGVRFKASFQSDENWYAINEYGGKMMVLGAIPILCVGLYGFFQPQISENLYYALSILVWILSVLIAGFLSWKKAKSMEKNEAQPTK